MAARYPLPYAFARNQQLLLEQDGDQLTLWLHAQTPPGGISETLRKYDARRLEILRRCSSHGLAFSRGKILDCRLDPGGGRQRHHGPARVARSETLLRFARITQAR